MALGLDVMPTRAGATLRPGGQWSRALARRVHRAASVAALALAVVSLPACSVEKTYTADPIAARVVDADTGAPVEGVNVVAAWQAKGGLEGGNVMGYVTVMEDVTNANGEFSFPGWGPKKWRKGSIRDGAPLLILFKPGFDASFVWEPKYGLEFATHHMSSSWNGKAIPLRRFAGTMDDYTRRLSGLEIYTMSIVRDGGCSWRHMPRFLAEIDRQHRLYVASNMPLQLYGLDYLDDVARSSCGSLKAFVEGNAR